MQSIWHLGCCSFMCVRGKARIGMWGDIIKIKGFWGAGSPISTFSSQRPFLVPPLSSAKWNKVLQGKETFLVKEGIFKKSSPHRLERHWYSLVLRSYCQDCFRLALWCTLKVWKKLCPTEHLYIAANKTLLLGFRTIALFLSIGTANSIFIVLVRKKIRTSTLSATQSFPKFKLCLCSS